MLEAAEASLKALNKNDITEVKAMKRPPVGVVLVIETICIVKKVKPNKARIRQNSLYVQRFAMDVIYTYNVHATCR